jgi:tetrahydromethanopterin S-methyltransferase subunit D
MWYVRLIHGLIAWEEMVQLFFVHRVLSIYRMGGKEEKHHQPLWQTLVALLQLSLLLGSSFLKALTFRRLSHCILVFGTKP